MEFILSQCILREWKRQDAPALAKHANNPKIAGNLRDGFPYPYTLKNAEKWISDVAFIGPHIILAIDIGNEAVGGIGIFFKEDVYRKNAEIGYWLSEMYWNRGIMTEAVNTLVGYTFEHYDILRISAAIFEHNKASMHLLEKCGFRREAIHRQAVIKNGHVMDEYVWAIFKSNLKH
jgi:ribosomal-protein-alanine N-acetyltransferase